MNKKHFPVFYTIYFTVIIIFVVALLIILGIVRKYLADYESVQPQYEAQRIFEKYYSNEDFDLLVSASEIQASPFEDPHAIATYLAASVKGKEITYNSISTGLDTTIKYIVKADNVKFSSFTLKKSGLKSEKGFDTYTEGNFEVFCTGTESVRITVPRGSRIYINNILLDDSFRTGFETRDISCEHMPDGVEGLIYDEYFVDSLYLPPETIRVTDRENEELLLKEKSDGSYYAEIRFSESLKANYSDYVISAAKALAAYMQNDGRFSAVAPYIDPTSELYTNIRTSETYFVINHSSFAFEDMKTSEFYAYDDNTFSCRVSFTHVLKRAGSPDYRDYIDITFYLRKVDGSYQIYDRYNH